MPHSIPHQLPVTYTGDRQLRSGGGCSDTFGPEKPF